MKHHFRLQCPEELGVVVCEVQLNGVEEVPIGVARESRPALTVGDPTLPFFD